MSLYIISLLVVIIPSALAVFLWIRLRKHPAGSVQRMNYGGWASFLGFAGILLGVLTYTPWEKTVPPRQPMIETADLSLALVEYKEKVGTYPETLEEARRHPLVSRHLLELKHVPLGIGGTSPVLYIADIRVGRSRFMCSVRLENVEFGSRRSDYMDRVACNPSEVPVGVLPFLALDQSLTVAEN